MLKNENHFDIVTIPDECCRRHVEVEILVAAESKSKYQENRWNFDIIVIDDKTLIFSYD